MYPSYSLWITFTLENLKVLCTPTYTYHETWLILKITSLHTRTKHVLFSYSNDLCKRKFNQAEHLHLVFFSTYWQQQRHPHQWRDIKKSSKSKGCAHYVTIHWLRITFRYKNKIKHCSSFHAKLYCEYIFCSKEMHLPLVKSIGFKDFLVKFTEPLFCCHIQHCECFFRVPSSFSFFCINKFKRASLLSYLSPFFIHNSIPRTYTVFRIVIIIKPLGKLLQHRK